MIGSKFVIGVLAAGGTVFVGGAVGNAYIKGWSSGNQAPLSKAGGVNLEESESHDLEAVIPGDEERIEPEEIQQEVIEEPVIDNTSEKIQQLKETLNKNQKLKNIFKQLSQPIFKEITEEFNSDNQIDESENQDWERKIQEQETANRELKRKIVALSNARKKLKDTRKTYWQRIENGFEHTKTQQLEAIVEISPSTKPFNEHELWSEGWATEQLISRYGNNLGEFDKFFKYNNKTLIPQHTVEDFYFSEESEEIEKESYSTARLVDQITQRQHIFNANKMAYKGNAVTFKDALLEKNGKNFYFLFIHLEKATGGGRGSSLAKNLYNSSNAVQECLNKIAELSSNDDWKNLNH